MNRDQITGKWHELKGHAKIQWGLLTDDDLAKLDGTKEKLIGLVQHRYGYVREIARQSVDEFWQRQNGDGGLSWS
jgi:uncharacterized protein YjbJ (UPF0337 family)